MTQRRRRCLSGSFMSVSDKGLRLVSGSFCPFGIPHKLPSHAGSSLQTRNRNRLLLSLCLPQGYPCVQQKAWLLENGAWHMAVAPSCAAQLWPPAAGAQLQAFPSGQRPILTLHRPGAWGWPSLLPCPFHETLLGGPKCWPRFLRGILVGREGKRESDLL